MILWPWRKGRLKWVRSEWSYIWTSGNCVVSGRKREWIYSDHEFMICPEAFHTRRAAMRACEIHALNMPLPRHSADTIAADNTGKMED